MKDFKIIVSGYGGQGVLTLAEIIALAGQKKGFQVQQAELHGLAQRGGSLRTDISFGREVLSPLIKKGDVDLIISLDLLEALRSCQWSDPTKTIVLTNSTVFWPDERKISTLKTEKKIRRLSKELKIVEADKIVQKLTNQKMAVNIYLLGAALREKLLPFDAKTAWSIVARKLKGKFLEENRKVFDQARKEQ